MRIRAVGIWALCGGLLAGGCGRGGREKSPEAEMESAPPAVREELQAGLVLGLTFEDGLADFGSSGLTVTSSGVQFDEAGRFGIGGRFADGAFLSIADLSMTEEGSWCVWIKTDAPQAEKEVRALDANAFTIGIVKEKFFANFYDGAIRRLRGERVEPGKWRHVAMTWEQGYVKLYINGVVFDQGIYKKGPGVSRRDLHVGVRWTGSTKAFAGVLDDLCIYDRALSADELRLLMRGLLSDDSMPVVEEAPELLSDTDEEQGMSPEEPMTDTIEEQKVLPEEPMPDAVEPQDPSLQQPEPDAGDAQEALPQESATDTFEAVDPSPQETTPVAIEAQ